LSGKFREKVQNNHIKTKFIPIYNEKNYSFFNENVFINKDDINDFTPSKIDIFKNQKINTNFYGKINIFNDGNIFANFCQNRMGNIKDMPQKLLCNNQELTDSWCLTRNKVKPCKNCIFCDFCPPISNYELVLDKPNLCNL
jgi:pseudo-rSAM protein